MELSLRSIKSTHMNTIRLHDKIFELFIPADKINQAVENIALRMNTELQGKNPVFISVLKGSFMFTSDLMKKLNFDCSIGFIRLSSYTGTSSTGHVKKLIGLDEDIKDRTVVVIEDIVDTGLTLEHTIRQLEEFHPSEIRVASFLMKPEVFRGSRKPEYVGIEVANRFIVGYGLDYNELGRNLPDIYVLVDE